MYLFEVVVLRFGVRYFVGDTLGRGRKFGVELIEEKGFFVYKVGVS